jgi:hypothetical protein
MTTYRLLNNVNEFHEALVDFREMRKQRVRGQGFETLRHR